MIHQAIDTGITDPTDCSADNYPSRIDAYNRYNSPSECHWSFSTRPGTSFVIGHLELPREQLQLLHNN